jgi:pimeloyl-ACP methyl ester carboxylesterase
VSATPASYVLVHGALHAAWCWEPTARTLRARGHQVVAIDLPGRNASPTEAARLTLDDHVACIARTVDAWPQSVLVAHSFGGVPAREFAARHPGAIKMLAYVNAVVPDADLSAFATLSRIEGESVLMTDGALVSSDNGALMSLDPALVIDAFYGRCSASDADWAKTRLCAEPVGPLITATTGGANGLQTPPQLYIGAAHDRSVPPAAQRAMCARHGLERIELDSDHSPFLSAPTALTGVLGALV